VFAEGDAMLALTAPETFRNGFVILLSAILLSC